MADDDEQLRPVIRRKVHSGELPRMHCRMTWYGPGTHSACVACDQPIELTEVEIECDLPAGGTLRLHRRCYDIWVAEWTARCENNASTGTDAG
jgi:hypothetical protein